MIWTASSGSGAPIFLGNVLLTLGEEAGMAYLRKLAKQKIAKSTVSGRAMLDLVAAGEYSQHRPDHDQPKSFPCLFCLLVHGPRWFP